MFGDIKHKVATASGSIWTLLCTQTSCIYAWCSVHAFMLLLFILTLLSCILTGTVYKWKFLPGRCRNSRDRGGGSGWIFRAYINIGYKFPPIIRSLAGITDKKLETSGESFTSAFKGLASFIRQEQGTSSTDLTIISHEGMLMELLTNCMKNDIEYNFFKGVYIHR